MLIFTKTPFLHREYLSAGNSFRIKKLGQAPQAQIRQLLRKIYYGLPFKESPAITYKKAVSKVNYCATVVPGEINVLRSWSFYHAETVPFSYASIEDDFKDLQIDDDFVPQGNGILVGNSVAPTSNHLDALQQLKEVGVKDMDIIVPLSYGVDFAYKDVVMSEGAKMFGSNFKPLLSFLQKKEYIEILLKCRVAVMNHERQQGLGNILILLWLGIKIFLSENNLIYPYLKNMGIHIYAIQQDMTIENLQAPLSSDIVKRNRAIIRQEYGHDAVLNKVNKMIRTIAAQ